MPDPEIKPHLPHPPEWAEDLNPDFMAGQNTSWGDQSREVGPSTAYDIKQAHRWLQDFSDDELKSIPILPEGSRLEQGAVYIDLHDPDRQEFKAMGHHMARPGQWLVPKTEVDYRLWNRLLAVTDPTRSEQRRAS